MENIFIELSVFNHIKFYDEDHTYRSGDKQFISGTGIVGLYKEKFEAEKMAKLSAKKKGVEPEELLAEWDLNRDIAATRGTLVHSYIENYLNNKVFPFDYSYANSVEGQGEHIKAIYEPCVELWLDFHEDSKDSLIPVKSEIVIGDLDWMIAGQIDQLYWSSKQNSFMIFDWKTSKEVRDKSKYGKKMKAPLNFLQDCEITSFALQLSVYRLIVEKNTNIRVAKCYVVHVNDMLEKYQLIEVPDYRPYAMLMIEHYLQTKSKQK